VIDPVLVYSTFLGGAAADTGFAIAVDAAGAAYVAGWTSSGNFPTTLGALDTTFNGGGGPSVPPCPAGCDAFVTKLNPAGSALIYSTYLGGSGADQAFAIAVDAVGSAYVVGSTASANFPTTAGAPDISFNGVADAFVTKLDAAGSGLLYSTFLGGTSFEVGRGIAVDAAGRVYVAGWTSSTNFPTTPGAFDTTHNGDFDAFITKFDLGAACPSEPDDSGDDHELGPDDADGNGIDDEGERG
jgi:hypothetical protein